MRNRTGGCNCGKVRFQAEGDPIRVGICHCQICRKDTGSSFNFFAVWSSKNVTIIGDTESWIHQYRSPALLRDVRIITLQHREWN